MKLIRVQKDNFSSLHSDAHLLIFQRPFRKYDFDFAIMAINEEDRPVHYYTIKEHSPTWVHIAYGGALPGFKGKKKSFPVMKQIIEDLYKTHKRITFLTDVGNRAMQKFASFCDFEVSGVNLEDEELKILYEYKPERRSI